MAGKEFKTKGGASLFVSYVGFEDGVEMAKAVNRVAMDSKLLGNQDRKLELTLRLFGDAEVYQRFMAAAKAATYNGKKVDAALFDDPKAGEAASADLLEIFDTIVDFNIARFFRGASSASSATPPAA
jgi:hypothetical protein